MKLRQCSRLKIHPAAWCLAAFMIIKGQGAELLIILMALVNHEAAHAFAAQTRNCAVPQIELTPFGAVARVEDLQQIPLKDQALIAAAGPLASAGAVISCLSGIRYLPESWQYRCAFGAVVNLSLLLVNLLPVLPLDGGRILLAITARRIGLQRAAKWLGRAGVWAGVAMIALSLYLAVAYNTYNMTLALCGCYLVYTANVCCKELIAHWIHGIILKRSYIENRQMMPIKELAVSSKCTVRDFCRLMKPGAYYRVSVINASALDLMGTLEEAQIQKAVMGNAAMTFEEVLRLSNQAP